MRTGTLTEEMVDLLDPQMLKCIGQTVWINEPSGAPIQHPANGVQTEPGAYDGQITQWDADSHVACHKP